jgi:hypothetical protein
MITKTFLLAKTFRAYGTNFLRQDKFFRDHVLIIEAGEVDDALWPIEATA